MTNVQCCVVREVIIIFLFALFFVKCFFCCVGLSPITDHCWLHLNFQCYSKCSLVQVNTLWAFSSLSFIYLSHPILCFHALFDCIWSSCHSILIMNAQDNTQWSTKHCEKYVVSMLAATGYFIIFLLMIFSLNNDQ